jgi:hypothetical protein
MPVVKMAVYQALGLMSVIKNTIYRVSGLMPVVVVLYNRLIINYINKHESKNALKKFEKLVLLGGLE